MRASKLVKRLGQRFESARRLCRIGVDPGHYSAVSRRASLHGGDHRKPPPTIALCRTLDEEVFGVYGEDHSHVVAGVAFPCDAHRLAYALSLNRRSRQCRSLAHFDANPYHLLLAFQSSRVLTIFAARRKISAHASPSTSRGRSKELRNSSTSTPASR